jgi:hypothetical protein
MEVYEMQKDSASFLAELVAEEDSTAFAAFHEVTSPGLDLPPGTPYEVPGLSLAPSRSSNTE